MDELLYHLYARGIILIVAQMLALTFQYQHLNVLVMEQ